MFVSANCFADACMQAKGQAVVVMYHQFNAPYPSTSVTADQLQSHINYFLSSGFNIVPLKTIVDYVKNKIPIPDKTIAITLDDAYRSAYKIAHPIFKKYKIPYTVFVNTEGIDRGFKAYMTWGHLREISKSGLASLQAHGHVHGRLVRNFNSTERKKDVLTSVRRIYKETGVVPKYFAYPYGENSNQFIKELKSYRMKLGRSKFKFEAAFSTQSGPIGCSSSLFKLPRFALNESYGKLGQTFYIKMNSLHLPIVEYNPSDAGVCVSERRKNFSFKLHPSFSSKSGVNCFASNAKAYVQRDSSTGYVYISLEKGFGDNSTERLNCTIAGLNGRYYWLGREFFVYPCS